jgi:hypothetical protein
VDLAYASGSDAQDNGIDLNPSYLGGAAGWPQLQIFPSNGQLSVSFNGLPEVTTNADALFDGLAHHIRWTASQSGTSIAWTVYLDGVSVNTGTAATSTLPSVSTIALVAEAGSSALANGYVTVWTSAPTVADMTAAILGYPRELATDRIQRLCDEHGIPVTVTVGSVDAQPMGPQGIDTVANLLDGCAALDNGLLHDAGPLGSLVYVSGTARYNAAVAFAITNDQLGSATAGTYDDQGLVNSQQITRVNGATVTYDDVDSEALDDDYGAEATINAAADTQILDIASFRTHLGSFDAYRFGAIPLDARHLPELVQALLNLAIPARISPGPLPLPFPPGAMDQFVEGFRITLDTATWLYGLNCTPFEPWRMGVYDTSKADSGSSTLATAVVAGTIGATLTLSVATALAGDLWTTDSSQWTAGSHGPLYVVFDGEIAQVTNITGSTSPQSITVTRGYNGVAIKHPAGTPVHVYQAAVAAL